jgi:hypothetical protein
MRLFSIFITLIFSLQVLANKPITSIPFSIKNGHMFIKLRVNDSEPLHFVFDTGAAANLITDQTAATLGIEASGSQSVQGASGSTNVKRSNGHSVTLTGNEQLDDINFLILNIDHLSDEDTPLDGIIGASILSRYVVEIDYDTNEIKLYDQDDFKTPGSDWHPEKFSLATFRVPIISASITLPSGEKHEGRYLVDTGAATSVKFNTPFVKKMKLIKNLGNHYAYTSKALSQESVDEVSKLPAYEVFGQTFEDFAVRLSQTKKGVSGYSTVEGILGIDILKRFNTIYDYEHKTMYVQPNKAFKTAFPLNHDGLKVEKEEGAYRVVAVFDNSSAIEAGIEKGDLITSLDGRNDFTRVSFHDYIQHTRKKVIDVVLTRDGKEMKVKLKPKAML